MEDSSVWKTLIQRKWSLVIGGIQVACYYNDIITLDSGEDVLSSLLEKHVSHMPAVPES